MAELSFGRCPMPLSARRVRRVADEHPDAVAPCRCHVPIEMAELEADHDAARTLVQALWDEAEANGSPSLRSVAAVKHSYLAMHATPPDFVEAASWADTGLALARDVGSQSYEAGACLALGVSSVRLRRARTLDVVRSNLLINARSHGWYGIWRCFDILSYYWAVTGERERAAVLLGHPQAQGVPPGSIEYVNLRRDATVLLLTDLQQRTRLARRWCRKDTLRNPGTRP